MARRQSIPDAADPLGAILGTVGQEREKKTEPSPRTERREGRAAPEAKPVRKRRMAFDLPVELAEQIRDCVMHLSGPPLHLNLSRFAEEAFERELERLRAAHNDGDSFPDRIENPRPGRPLR